MAAVCGRFHLSPGAYWAMTGEEEEALVSFLEEEIREKRKANRRR